MNLRPAPAVLADVPAAVECAVAAFVDDPLMGFFFPGTVVERTGRCREFMSLLLRVRLALHMPAIVLKNEGRTVGLAMGYHTIHHDWPSNLQQEWDAFTESCQGLEQRFDAYDKISTTGTPTAPHYYLGVLAIHPSSQGSGLGGELLQAYCLASESDTQSQGIYLETAKAENVHFYERRGFLTRAQGSLGTVKLWCMYRPHARASARDA
jgi:GNAT superfamily N-acetyltransferase